MNGLIRLKPGDVCRLTGTLYIVDYANESRARLAPLNRRRKVITDHVFERQVSFEETGKSISVSRHCEPGFILERRGQEGLNQFLTSTKAARRQTNEQSAAATEEEKNMAKKGSKKSAAASTNGEPHSKGKLGELMGFSVVSVLRRLGQSDIKVAHARAIMEAQKIKVAPATVQIQVNNGKNGKGEPAGITKEQLKELIESAPEPAAEPKAEKKTKKGGGATKKGGRKAEPAGTSATESTYGVKSVASAA